MRVKIENVKHAVEWKIWKAAMVLKSQSAEGFVDTAIKILMAVVIGALLLAGLYTLFEDNVLFS